MNDTAGINQWQDLIDTVDGDYAQQHNYMRKRLNLIILSQYIGSFEILCRKSSGLGTCLQLNMGTSLICI